MVSFEAGDPINDRRELMESLVSAVARVDAGDPIGRMCRAMCEVLGADGASLTLNNASSNRVTLCATDETAARLESAQEVSGEGPCMDAFTSAVPISADLAQVKVRWPMFASRVETAGVSQFIAVPMRAGEAVLGVASLYQRFGNGLRRDVSEVTFLVDTVGASVMGEASELASHEELNPWPNRRDIHVATGMVVAQLAILQGDALAILRAHAYAYGSDLPDVARAVLAGDLIFSTDGYGHMDSDHDAAAVREDPADE